MLLLVLSNFLFSCSKNIKMKICKIIILPVLI